MANKTLQLTPSRDWSVLLDRPASREDTDFRACAPFGVAELGVRSNMRFHYQIAIFAIAMLTSCAIVTYPVAPRETVSMVRFQKYFAMTQHINNMTLPVGLDYLGKIGNAYVIMESTNRKSILGFLGGEEIALIKYIQVPSDQVPKGIFPEPPLTTKSERLSLDEIYALWTSYKIPLPILTKATLDNWNISKDSVLQPENAKRYNFTLIETE